MSVKTLYAGYRENNSGNLLSLRSTERAALNWAAIEEHDTVLDLECRGPAMLRLLKGSMNVQCCALCGSDSDAAYVRERADDFTVSVRKSPILPYRDRSFHIVLGAKRSFDRITAEDFGEIHRVMRPGAQLVLTAPLAAALKHRSGRLTMNALQEAGFGDISMRFSGLNAVIMARRKESLPAHR